MRTVSARRVPSLSTEELSKVLRELEELKRINSSLIKENMFLRKSREKISEKLNYCLSRCHYEFS
jgi:regulator of replication initiation timing